MGTFFSNFNIIFTGCSLFMEGLSRRDAGYPAPPAQSRTCSLPASGSSVVLPFARAKSVMQNTVFRDPRLSDSLCTLALSLVRDFRRSATGPTLDTDG
jgi:hypothetical protein